MIDPRVLVVGAGVSGLTAALLLARRGVSVEVHARAPGGLAGAARFRGIPCDLGSHRLHAGALALPLFREMAGDLGFRVRPRRGVLLLGRGRVPYPPTVRGLVGGLGLRAAAGMALGWARARLRRDHAWERDRLGDDDAGFERFVTARVGRAAFQGFYGPYVEKVWGMDPAAVSQTVARLRLSTTDPWALLRGGRGREAQTYVYPEQGFAAITAWLARAVEGAGVPVRLGAGWDPGAAARFDRVLYAGNLRDLVPTDLAHRGVYLVYLSLGCALPGEAETWYAPEARYWFGRVADVGGYAPGRVPPGEAVLCVEIPEGRWGRGRDFARGPALATLLDQLGKAAIVPRGAPVGAAMQVFVPDVYPVYRRGWRAEWRRAMTRAAERFPTALPFGRQGLYLHCNTDHCVAVAEAAVAYALSGGDARGWIARAEGFLGLRVRD